MTTNKKEVLFTALFLFAIFITGCETAAGATKGIACGIGSTAEGAVKDTTSLCGAIMNLDNWIRKNLW
ncbi:MAG: hypothetical protein QME65_02180 [Candidatus Omnitrophota bacterium]|nr:hypothetical protein [Candidatus Omnitrophota bacterium]